MFRLNCRWVTPTPREIHYPTTDFLSPVRWKLRLATSIPGKGVLAMSILGEGILAAEIASLQMPQMVS